LRFTGLEDVVQHIRLPEDVIMALAEAVKKIVLKLFPGQKMEPAVGTLIEAATSGYRKVRRVAVLVLGDIAPHITCEVLRQSAMTTLKGAREDRFWTVRADAETALEKALNLAPPEA